MDKIEQTSGGQHSRGNRPAAHVATWRLTEYKDGLHESAQKAPSGGVHYHRKPKSTPRTMILKSWFLLFFQI